MSLLQTIPVLLFATALTVVPSELVSPLTAQEVNLLTQDVTNFPVVNSARLEKNMRTPWSTPVRVIDPFEGSYLAVFDKHHWSKGLLGAEGSRQVISFWSRDFVRVLFTDTTSQCTSVYDPKTKQTISNCIDSDTTPQVRQLLLKIGEQVFQLDGQNNSFEVTKDLSSALTKAPDEEINIRLVLEGGESVDSRIGKRTVSAWKTVYQSPTSVNRSESAPPNLVSPIPLPGATSSQPTELEGGPKELIDEVWQIVNRQYIDATFNGHDWKAVRQQYLNRSYESNEDAYQSIREMLNLLGDSYTRFIDPQEFKNMQVDTSQDSVGIGLQLAQDEKTKEVVAIAPIEDTPAFMAGILSQDVLVKIDDQSTQGMDVNEVVRHLRGPAGTEVVVRVRRGQQEREFRVRRSPVVIHPVRYASQEIAVGKIGYIRLTQFSVSATEEMRSAITDLEKQQVAGYILDLRSNPGGLLSASAEIARMWINNGTIFSTVERQGETDRQQANNSAITDKPLVVLVDGGSAAASEILSGALQDNQRAVVVGTTTFGSNTIQSVRSLQNSSGLAVTVAKWLTPKGRDIQKSGLSPDVVVEMTEAQQQALRSQRQLIGTPTDPQYSKATEILTQVIQSSPRKNRS